MFTIIVGTNRQDAVSKKIAELYQDLLSIRDQKSEIIDLQELPSDFANSDTLYSKSDKGVKFNDFRERMHATQKMVFIVPEYNGSFPGVLKTFIDGLIFPTTFRDKKCALVGLSSGVQGAGLALSHLTDVFNYCGMHVLAQKPKLSRIEENLTENKLSELYLQLIEEQIDKFIVF